MCISWFQRLDIELLSTTSRLLDGCGCLMRGGGGGWHSRSWPKYYLSSHPDKKVRPWEKHLHIIWETGFTFLSLNDMFFFPRATLCACIVPFSTFQLTPRKSKIGMQQEGGDQWLISGNLGQGLCYMFIGVIAENKWNLYRVQRWLYTVNSFEITFPSFLVWFNGFSGLI